MHAAADHRPIASWSVAEPCALFLGALLATAFLLHTVSQWGGPAFAFDDAYIVLHNAEVLLSGGRDPNFAGTPALVGSTSPVHLALVAGLGLVLPLPWALHVALWLGVALYAFGVFRLSRLLGATGPAALVLAACGLLAGRAPHQLLNGLETGLAMAAVSWALVFAVDRRFGRGPRLGLSALCGLMPFVRPELGLLSVMLFALVAWRLVTECERRAALRALAGCAVVAGLAAAPWLVWNLAATGHLVPVTIAAKRAWFAEAGQPLGSRAGTVASALLVFLLGLGPLALAGLVFLPGTAAGRLGGLFAVLFLAAYSLSLPGALFHNDQRYLYVLLPILLMGAAAAFRDARGPRSLVARRPLVYAGLLALPALLLFPGGWSQHLDQVEFTRRECDGVADWARRNLPGDARLLIHDAGYIAWDTPFPLGDLVGLKTPSSIPDHLALTLPSGGEERPEAMARIAERSDATHLVVLDEWDGLFDITAGLRSEGWALEPLRTEGAYDVYRLDAPGP